MLKNRVRPYAILLLIMISAGWAHGADWKVLSQANEYGGITEEQTFHEGDLSFRDRPYAADLKPDECFGVIPALQAGYMWRQR